MRNYSAFQARPLVIGGGLVPGVLYFFGFSCVLLFLWGKFVIA